MYYVLRKMIAIVFTLFIVSLITFSVFEIIPGDPIIAKLGIDADEAQIKALREELQLDLPLSVRYRNWISNALRGDLGESIRFDTPVSSLIRERLQVTFLLAILSLLITIIIGIPLGIITAKYDNHISGIVISLASQLGMALPSFWLGLIMTYIFGLILMLFVPGKYIPISTDFFGALKYLFFPATALAIPKIAVIVRYLRTSVLEEKNQDYVRTAFSKGLTNNLVLYGHILRNALIPVLTIIGMIIADVLGGSLIIEQVFTIPGIGRLLIMAITNRDFPLVQGMVLYIAAIVVLINFIVDILYHIIDPRISIK